MTEHYTRVTNYSHPKYVHALTLHKLTAFLNKSSKETFFSLFALSNPTLKRLDLSVSFRWSAALMRNLLAATGTGGTETAR